ncbi:MAG: hypothetical protein AAF959_22075 [Cyanobacteria bacterium P01_D01_bin.56]
MDYDEAQQQRQRQLEETVRRNAYQFQELKNVVREILYALPSNARQQQCWEGWKL